MLQGCRRLQTAWWCRYAFLYESTTIFIIFSLFLFFSFA